MSSTYFIAEVSFIRSTSRLWQILALQSFDCIKSRGHIARPRLASTMRQAAARKTHGPRYLKMSQPLRNCGMLWGMGNKDARRREVKQPKKKPPKPEPSRPAITFVNKTN